MIRDRDRRLYEQQLGSLASRHGRTCLHLNDAQAEIYTVPVAHDRLGAAGKSDKSPMAPQRTPIECQRHLIIQLGVASLLGGTVEQRQTMYVFSDKAHTCQKEQ